MSGPKVVRIVTREEIQALCNAELARLDAALGQWVRLAEKAGGLTQEELESAKRRRDELAALITADRFLEFQKSAGQEIAFLASDSQMRLARIAEQRAAAAAAARRQRQAASALMNTLRSKGITISEDLSGRLRAVVEGKEDQAAMAQGFAALSPPSDGGAEERKRLAALHRDNGTVPSWEEWMRSQPLSADEARLVKVDRRLAEVEGLGPAEPRLLAAREAAEAENNDKRRALLLDSLELDLAGLIAAAKTRAALDAELSQSLAALKSLSTAAYEELAARRAALVADDALAPLLEEVKAAIEDARTSIAARARRDAVLSALAGLGYEVTEGMETAWANDGQLVLRSAARPDYGVEINGQAERLQMRAVAFEEGDAAVPDQARDRDAEAIWCGEVGALREALDRSGGELEIVKARAIGEVPLKRVKGGKDPGRRRDIGKLKTRTAG